MITKSGVIEYSFDEIKKYPGSAFTCNNFHYPSTFRSFHIRNIGGQLAWYYNTNGPRHSDLPNNANIDDPAYNRAKFTLMEN